MDPSSSRPAKPGATTTAAAITTAPGLLGGLVSLDSKVSYHLHSLFRPFLPHLVLLLLELSADFRFFFPVCLSLLLLPPPFPTHRLRPFLVPFLLGLLLDLALVGLLKLLVRRSRPHYNPAMSAAVSADHFSFPSGHSSRVFFVAALVHLSIAAFVDALAQFRSGSDEGSSVNLLILVVWVWAAATSLSRVLLGRHFVVDVFAGACLGVLEALFAFHFLRIEKFLR
ncbi:Phosphatidic acid phosphatase type 2/haloperoxidase [Parasponia andersonii]|uniref:Phosphatidic acid phosphatase type 2/haloperoxidase n=1 Tax=Parasponia andersonii TaxID=3476 RepID=A0A2P5BYG1_PARAD|nr:Phosphatidic acid phosphatase type 2/haloperoxidase [Parasponia andersonii]